MCKRTKQSNEAVCPLPDIFMFLFSCFFLYIQLHGSIPQFRNTCILSLLKLRLAWLKGITNNFFKGIIAEKFFARNKIVTVVFSLVFMPTVFLRYELFFSSFPPTVNFFVLKSSPKNY